MRARSIGRFCSAAAIALALVLVVNPEVRAFLLIADALGLELLGFLFLIQLRSFAPLVAQLRPSLSQCWRGALHLLVAQWPSAASSVLLVGPFTYALGVAVPVWSARLAHQRDHGK